MKIDIISLETKRKLEFIENQVLNITGLDSLKTKSRTHEYVLGRFLFCLLAREYTSYSFSKIGSYINRDHATIIHSVRACTWEMKYNKDLQNKYDNLKIIMENQFVVNASQAAIADRIKVLEHQLFNLKKQYNESFNPEQQDKKDEQIFWS